MIFFFQNKVMLTKQWWVIHTKEKIKLIRAIKTYQCKTIVFNLLKNFLACDFTLSQSCKGEGTIFVHLVGEQEQKHSVSCLKYHQTWEVLSLLFYPKHNTLEKTHRGSTNAKMEWQPWKLEQFINYKISGE